MQSKLLTIKDVAERYPIPEATLRYWRHRHEGPPSARIGRRVVYREVDVEAWVEAQFAAERPPAVAAITTSGGTTCAVAPAHSSVRSRGQVAS